MTTDPILTGRIDDDKGRPRNVYTFPDHLADKSAFGEQMVAGGDNISIDLMKLQIRMPPTLHLIVTGFKSSGAAADVTASLTYYEDL